MEERLGIAGSGAIACGLAASAARAGEVLLWARSDQSAKRAHASISRNCVKLLGGEVDPDRVRIVTDIDAARKHCVAVPDILHAIDHALAIEDAGEDPHRWLLIGPDTAGNLLEVVIMITAEGTQLVIHAMPMRDQYRRLLGL